MSEETAQRRAAQRRARYAANREKELAQSRARYVARRKEKLAYSKAYFKAHREEYVAYHRAYRARNPARGRAQRLMKKYNLTIEQFDELLASQQGLCAVCNLERAAVVDHRHCDGKVRGLLCSKCNRALGLFHDNISSLATAIEYLKR